MTEFWERPSLKVLEGHMEPLTRTIVYEPRE